MANKEPLIIRGHEIAGRMPQFKPELRQANRNGDKTMTRRVMKVQPPGPEYKSCTLASTTDREMKKHEGASHWVKLDESGLNIIDDQGRYFRSRYKVGDIRVMCEPLKRTKGGPTEGYSEYADDGYIVRCWGKPSGLWFRWSKDYLTSIHMPYEAGRSLFKINEIRAERLQDISFLDATAEGLYREWDGRKHWYGTSSEDNEMSPDPRKKVAQLWDSINADPKRAHKNPYTGQPEECYVSYPWEDIRETRERSGLKWYVIGNPWNWVIGYEVVK